MKTMNERFYSVENQDTTTCITISNVTVLVSYVQWESKLRPIFKKCLPTCDQRCDSDVLHSYVWPLKISRGTNFENKIKKIIQRVANVLQKQQKDIKVIDSYANNLDGKIDLGTCKGFCSR